MIFKKYYNFDKVTIFLKILASLFIISAIVAGAITIKTALKTAWHQTSQEFENKYDNQNNLQSNLTVKDQQINDKYVKDHTQVTTEKPLQAKVVRITHPNNLFIQTYNNRFKNDQRAIDGRYIELAPAFKDDYDQSQQEDIIHYGRTIYAVITDNGMIFQTHDYNVNKLPAIGDTIQIDKTVVTKPIMSNQTAKKVIGTETDTRYDVHGDSNNIFTHEYNVEKNV